MPKVLTLSGLHAVGATDEVYPGGTNEFDESTGLWRPSGFALCQPAPPDAQVVGGPKAAGDWSITLYRDPSTDIHYIEYFRTGAEGDEWIWYCGTKGDSMTGEELLAATEAAWERGSGRTATWAAIGGLAGIIGGVMIAGSIGESRLLGGGVGGALGAGIGAVALTMLRSSQAPSMAGVR